MVILYITGHGLGGSNVSLANSILELKRLGVEETIIVPDKDTLKPFIGKGLHCIVVPFRPSIWPVCKRWYHYLSFPVRLLYQQLMNFFAIHKLLNLSKRIQPEIIHTNISVMSIGYKLSKQIHVPHVYHLREYSSLDFCYRRYPSDKSFKRALNNSYSISITKSLYDYYSLSNNSVVIYNGIMPKKNYISCEKENYFLYVGGLTHEKGIDHLIDTFLTLISDGNRIELKICGTGNAGFVSSLQSKINKAGKIASSYITFMGQRDDVYSLMFKAKAIIVPSLSEAFGRITAEAMFNDCLVIGNNTAGTKEQFDNGLDMTGREIGLRYKDQETLKAALLRVNDNGAELFSEQRKAAFNVVNSLYTTENNANKIYDFYNKILKYEKN